MTLIGTIFLQRKVILQKESIILKTSIEVILSQVILPVIFWSFQSLKKINRDRMALFDLLKRLTVIKSLSSIF